MPVRRAHLPCHRRFMETKVQFGFVAIVGAAAELVVFDRRSAPRTYTTEPSTHASSRPCRSQQKACQVPRSCDENVLLDATRSGPSCKECLDPEMWDYWWNLDQRDLRTALLKDPLPVEVVKE